MQECARLCVPIAAHKTEGPATVVSFLGIHSKRRAAPSGGQVVSTQGSSGGMKVVEVLYPQRVGVTDRPPEPREIVSVADD